MHELRDKNKSHELYLQVKSEVENCLAYLREKREHDPYRHLISRLVYQATHGFSAEVPTFEIWFCLLMERNSEWQRSNTKVDFLIQAGIKEEKKISMGEFKKSILIDFSDIICLFIIHTYCLFSKERNNWTPTCKRKGTCVLVELVRAASESE